MMVTLTRRQSATTWELEHVHGELPPQVCRDWDELAQIDALAPVFTYREWFALAARDRALPRWYVLTIRRHDRPIALFPLSKRSARSWEVISWFGHDEPQVLIDPMEETAAWNGVAHWLRHYPGAGGLLLSACGNQQRIAAFTQACHDEGMMTNVSDKVNSSVVFPLPGSWEALLATLGAETRAGIRQAERHIARDYPDAAMEMVEDPRDCREVIDDLERLYLARWGGWGGGCALDPPPSRAFYRHALEWALAQRYAVIGALSVGGRRIAIQTVFHIPGQSTLYMQMSARDMDGLPKRYRPGMMVLNHLLRWAIDRGATTANIGIGVFPYKLSFNGEIHQRWIAGAARTPWDSAMLPRLDRLLRVAHRAPVYAANYLRGLLKPRHGLDHP